MCLDISLDIKSYYKYDTVCVYKLFTKVGDNQYVGLHFGPVPSLEKDTQKYELNKQYNAISFDIRDVNGEDYTSGFHAYTRKECAQLMQQNFYHDAIIIMCYLTNLVSWGTQHGVEVVVGEKLTLNREVS